MYREKCPINTGLPYVLLLFQTVGFVGSELGGYIPGCFCAIADFLCYVGCSAAFHSILVNGFITFKVLSSCTQFIAFEVLSVTHL